MGRSSTPLELHEGMANGSVPCILDVRNQDDYALWQVEGVRPGATTNVPIWVAMEECEKLARDIPDGTVVVCAHGNGSELLLDVLAARGRDASISPVALRPGPSCS